MFHCNALIWYQTRMPTIDIVFYQYIDSNGLIKWLIVYCTYKWSVTHFWLVKLSKRVEISQYFKWWGNGECAWEHFDSLETRRRSLEEIKCSLIDIDVRLQSFVHIQSSQLFWNIFELRIYVSISHELDDI